MSAVHSLLRLADRATLQRVQEAHARGQWVIYLDGPVPDLTNPTELLDSGLYLAEEFARIDLGDGPDDPVPSALAEWYVRRGALRLFGPRSPYASKMDEYLVDAASGPPGALDWFFQEVAGVHAEEGAGDWSANIDPSGRFFFGGSADSRYGVRERQEGVINALEALADRPRDWSPHAVPGARTALQFDVVDAPAGGGLDIAIRWTSVLQPIYIQLQRAMDRAIRGHQAGARCRSCGLPFLILDGRRSTYCNTKCRNRHNVREFRKRQKEARDGR